MNMLQKIKSLLPVTKRKIDGHVYFIVGNKDVYGKYTSKFSKSYSQDGEDMLIRSLYEENLNYNGFYVDIGAHDPIRFSNTQYFYEKGWRGINIDATPGSMKRFESLRSCDINLECAVSDGNEEIVYYCFEESALNSFDILLSEKRITDGWKLKEKVLIPTQSINSILDKHLPSNQRIDFVDIDIEGMELQILKVFDFEKYAPKYFLIEDLSNSRTDLLEIMNSEISGFMKEKQYFPILKCKRTIVYARKN